MVVPSSSRARGRVLARFVVLGAVSLGACGESEVARPRWLHLAYGHAPGPARAVAEGWDLGPGRRLRERPDGSLWLEHDVPAAGWRAGDEPDVWTVARPDGGGPGLLTESGQLELRLGDRIVPRGRGWPGQETTTYDVDSVRLLLHLPAGTPDVTQEAVFSGRLTRGVEANGAWRVPLANLVAEGIPVWTGERVALTVDVPADACLRFETAALGLAEGPLVLRVSLDGESLLEEHRTLASGVDPRAHAIALAGPRRGARLVLEAQGTPARAAFLNPVIGPAEVGAPARRPTGSAVRPNVVLFVADTFRADLLTEWGGTRGTLPFLDDLVARSVRFLDARSTSTWTLPAHASMFTGLYPGQHGAETPAETFAPELVTLAELLRAGGYRTEAVTDAGYVSRAFGMDQGFERFQEYRLTSGTPNLRWVLDHARGSLARDDGRPLFLFVHSFRVHQPYRVGDEEDREPQRELMARFLAGRGAARDPARRDRLRRDLADDVRALYVEGARAFDRGLGRWYEDLVSAGWLAPGLLVFTSDHGEAFFEHGRMGHKQRPHDELARVPLVLHGSGLEPRAVTLGASLVDLAPTVVDWLGLEPLARWEGESLLRLARERLLFSMVTEDDARLVALVEGDRKVLVEAADDGTGPRVTEAYDLRADPAEQANLRDEADWPAALVDAARPRWDAITTRHGAGGDVELGDAVRGELEALGYAGD